MTDLQFLLSDEFVEFSTKIGDVHQRIKDLKAKFQADMKGLREEADILQKGFETWQNSQLKSPGKRSKTQPRPRPQRMPRRRPHPQARKLI